MHTNSYEKLMHINLSTKLTLKRVKKCRLKHSEIQERPQITPFSSKLSKTWTIQEYYMEK